MRKTGSRTAETSAAQRAFHTLHAHEPKVFEDPWALDLAGPMLKWLIRPRPMAWFIERWFAWFMPMIAHHVARARYVEERVDEFLREGLAQYVLLGAGMDSFVFRRPDLDGKLTVFEADHPGTQNRKRRRLKALGYPEPSHVTYLAVDFEKEALGAALARGGFDSTRLTLFAWMGVMPYLTEASISSTLEGIAKSAKSGSEIIFDTLDRAALTEGRRTTAGRKMFRAAERMGEPMITGFDPPEIGNLLSSAGFEMLEVVTPGAFTERWFRDRADGLAPWESVYVVRARVC